MEEIRNKQRTNNILSYGSVVKTTLRKDGQYVRVNVSGRLTPWLKVEMVNSPLLKVWLPMQVGEQVEVKHPMGDVDKGVVAHVGRGMPKGAKQNNVIIEAFGMRITMDNGIVKIFGNVEVKGNFLCTGEIMRHRGTNVGDTHTHGYDGEPV